MSKLTTYIFDLGGVINDHDNPVLIERLLSRCDSRASAVILTNKFCDDAYATGERSVIEFYQMLKREFGYGCDWQTFCDDWCCHLSMRAGMLDYLRELSQSSRILFLSNTNLVHWAKLLEISHFELASYEAFLSFDMGLAKPSSAIFEKVISAANIKPAETLFIDDRQENVEQARLSGLHAVLYTDQAEFLRVLSEFN